MSRRPLKESCITQLDELRSIVTEWCRSKNDIHYVGANWITEGSKIQVVFQGMKTQHFFPTKGITAEKIRAQLDEAYSTRQIKS